MVYQGYEREELPGGSGDAQADENKGLKRSNTLDLLNTDINQLELFRTQPQSPLKVKKTSPQNPNIF